MRSYKWLWLGFLFLLARLGAQGIPPVERLTETQLTNNRGWMLTKGCSGHLYVASDQGVLIFNGFTSQLVELPKGVTARSVFRGQDCRVYVGGYQNFGYINTENPLHPIFISLADTTFQQSNEEIWQIFANKESTIFQSFSAVFRLKDGQLKKIPLPSTIMLGKAIEGNLLIPSINGDRIYQIKDQGYEEWSLGDIFADKKITAIERMPQPDELLIATQRNELYRFAGGKLYPLKTEINAVAVRHQLNRVLRLKNGDYAFGTILNGLYVTDSLFRIKYNINQAHGLADNTVLSLYEDKKNLLYVGMDQGVNIVDLSSNRRHYYPAMDYGRIYSTVKHQGSIFLATNRGVFQQSDDKTSLIAGTQGQAWKLYLHQGDLLCAHNLGTLKIETNRATKISGTTGTWWLQAINDSTLLQSTYTGLTVMTKSKGVWQGTTPISNLLLNKFFLSPDNHLLGIHPHFGYYTAVLSSDFRQLSAVKRHLPSSPLDKLLDSEIISLKEKTYFIVHGDYFHLQDTSLVNVPESSPDHPVLTAIKCQLEQQNGTDGGQVFPLDDRSYLFPTDQGFYVQDTFVDCSGPLRNARIQYVTVEDSLRLSDGTGITLKPNFDNLAIQLETATPNRGIFQYQLKHWNKQWTTLGPDGRILYEKINPGTYELLLRTSPGEINSLLNITVTPPWYQSRWGYLLFTLLGLATLFLLKRYSDYRMRQQAASLRKETNRKLKEVKISTENKQLQQALLHKSEQLANSAMMLVKRDKLLNELQSHIKRIRLAEDQENIKNALVRKIKKDTKKDWELFQTNFNAVHQEFFERLAKHHPNISYGERQLAAYIRMELRSKEIAPLFNISIRSLENKRYRLRLSLGLDQGENLKEYLQQL